MPLPAYEPSPIKILVHIGRRGGIRIDAVHLEKTRWNNEPSRPTGNDGVTRGCSTA